MSSQDPVARDDAHEDEERDSVPPMRKDLGRARRRPASDKPQRTEFELPVVLKAQTADATPLVPSIYSTQSIAGYMDPDVKAYLKSHFKGSVVRRYSIARFIRNVWNFDIRSLRLDTHKQFKLNEEYMKDYYGGTFTKSLVNGKVRREGEAAIAFEKIWRDLCAQFPASAGHTPMTFLNLKDREVKGDYAKYKPDFGFTPTMSIQEQVWEYVVDCGELKKVREERVKDEEAFKRKLTIQANRLEAVYSITKRKRDDDVSDNTEDEEKADPTYGAKPRYKSRRTGRKSSAPAGQSTSSTLPPATWGEEEGPAALTGNELQIAKYLNELLSHGVRTYATGFLLQDFNMTLWYADRMGLVQSEPFNIFNDAPTFLLVVAAHHYGKPHDFGLNPMISLPDGTPHLLTYENTILRLPTAISALLPPVDVSPADASAFDEGTVLGPQSMEFQVNLDEGRQLSTAYGTIGRGTAVIPIVAGAGAAARLEGVRLVAKIACPQETRSAEDRFIRVIRRKLNEDIHARKYLKHVVDLKYSFSCKMGDERMILPRHKMAPIAEDLRRCFRVLIMPEYLPLERINSPDELKQIFVDTITGHHWVWKTSLILHRDISYGNIMFYRETDGAETKVVGVLTDWDLAEERDDDGTEVKESELQRLIEIEKLEKLREKTLAASDSSDEPSGAEKQQVEEGISQDEEVRIRQKARYRTGTGPFMACDLLHSGLTPKHLYRHDLESFFWVFAWFCAVFNPENHTIGIIPAWHQNNLMNVGTAKRAFLSSVEEYERIFAKTHPSYMAFVNSCLLDMTVHMNDASATSDTERIFADQYLRVRAWKEGTVRRDVYLASALKKLVDSRVHLRDMVTYEYFMDAFSIPFSAE